MKTNPPPVRRTLPFGHAVDRTDWIALGLVVLFALAGILTLPLYGLTWDEGNGNLFFGERYFLFFIHPSERYVDFKADLPEDHASIDLSLSPFRRYPQEVPPFTDTISAAFMHVLGFKLGWMDPVDAFHLPKVLLTAILLWLVYRFMRREAGVLAGFTSLLLLATYPRVWGDMHFNPKDVPEMMLFAATIFAYFSWQQKPTWLKAVGIGLLFAAALGTKANAVFIPFVLVLGLWPVRIDRKSWRDYLRAWGRDALHYVLMGLSATVLYVLSWPYLYVANSPVRGISKYFQYISSQGGRTGPAEWTWGPSLQVVTTMPEVTLLLVAVGMAVAAYALLRNDPRRVNRLLLVWCLLPIVRASLPGMVNFDGIRHFLEFVPAAVMLGGIAAERLVGIARSAPAQRAFAAAIVAAILANAMLVARNFWGFEHIYFNTLIGGLPGARAVLGDNEATDYWAGSYRQGMAWLKANADHDAVVYVPVVGYIAEMNEARWLRPDLDILGDQKVIEFTRTDRPAYIMLLQRPRYWDDYTRGIAPDLKPIHVIAVQGVPVLEIYRRP